ncbi:MAG: exonuclease SbcCD subunit D C-terminal domain-containing protein [Chlamydiota bacterium]
MKILHTSDWHLGRKLYNQQRYGEFEAFLDWLFNTIVDNDIDALLVAGDVFDNNAPSHKAQRLYYRFLCRVAESGCRQVVIVAGNHDSPTFLNAPKEVLSFLDIHVVGEGDNYGEQVITLKNSQGSEGAIVCAVPYLRDNLIREVSPGESLVEKDHKIVQGIRCHYQNVFEEAQKIQEKLETKVPLIAMGHLFVAGANTSDNDGVRELYVGSLARVGADIFSRECDYLALGHLHLPQLIGGDPLKRYCGSPLPMGFGEAHQRKSVCIIDFGSSTPHIETQEVPCFQKLARVEGDWPAIKQQIESLAQQDQNIWVEVVYQGAALEGDLVEQVEALTSKTSLKVLKVKNMPLVSQVLSRSEKVETLDDLTLDDVFERCLAAYSIPSEQQGSLREAYQEVLTTIIESDFNAE